MAEVEEEMSGFLKSGVYRFEGTSSNVVFMDSVRVLNGSYNRFRVSPSSYYSRFFESKGEEEEDEIRVCCVNSRKRKRKERRKTHVLNQRELAADQRHQEVRPLLLKAVEALLGAKDLLSFLPNLKSDGISRTTGIKQDARFRAEKGVEPSFIELGSIWQAPLYEITLYYRSQTKQLEDAGFSLDQYGESRVLPVFNNLIINEANDDMDAKFLDHWYVVPEESCFYMSELKQIQGLIPAKPEDGFNFIVIDPPWENGSANQKSVYPTLSSRYFLSLPVKQLTHTDGALVALWVTNKEKLRSFIEKELFPMWGVSYTASIYWLKVKADGSLISELDLFHHRPYECLLLGYCNGKAVDSKRHPSTFKTLQENQVIISVPGEFSRKPPVWKLLLDYVPGPKPARCIELFARELLSGWTSWGNEPLRFQESRYFLPRETEGESAG